MGLQAAMPPGSMPLEVSEVTYGMTAMIFIESTASTEDMAATLNAAYNGLVDAKINSKFTSKQILQNSQIKIKVYGGSTSGLSGIFGGYDGFMQIIKASTTYGPDSAGVPISYKLMNVVDRSMAQIAFTANYSIRRPIRVKQGVRITVNRYVVDYSDDEGANNDVDMNKFGVWAHAWEGNGVQIANTQPIDIWEGGPRTMAGGEAQGPGGQGWYIITFTGDTFLTAKLQLISYARDYDNTGADEQAWGEIILLGSQFLENGGKQVIRMSSDDFQVHTEITITLED
jgi:hypothetical protein